VGLQELSADRKPLIGNCPYDRKGESLSVRDEWLCACVASAYVFINKVLIPQVRLVHKYPISPWEMIHSPGGDNPVHI
jgi:hypothetical protein